MAHQAAAVTQAYLDIFQSRAIPQVADQAPPGEAGVDGELQNTVLQDVGHSLVDILPQCRIWLDDQERRDYICHDAARRKQPLFQEVFRWLIKPKLKSPPQKKNAARCSKAFAGCCWRGWAW